MLIMPECKVKYVVYVLFICLFICILIIVRFQMVINTHSKCLKTCVYNALSISYNLEV